MQQERKNFADGGKEFVLKLVGWIRRGRKRFQRPSLPNIYFSHEGKELQLTKEILHAPLYTRSLLETFMTTEIFGSRTTAPDIPDYLDKSRTSLINTWVMRGSKSLAEIIEMTDDYLIEKTDSPFNIVSVGYFRQTTNPLKERFLTN